MPPDLNIVHLTPGRLGLWNKSQLSPAFRSPPPWLSRPPSIPYPNDTKTSTFISDNLDDKSPPRYSRQAKGDANTKFGLPTRYHVQPYREAGVFSERSRMIQVFFSELFGTFIMILFGDGVVAQVTLSKETKGDFQSINWGYGIAVMLGVFVAKKSGGHLNPAVTLANCVYRRFPWHKLPIYASAQLLGAMLGALVVYLNYVSAIDMFEGGIDVRTVDNAATSTAGIFATYPVAFLSTKGQFFSEFLASAILMFCLFALVDAGVGNMIPLFLVFLIFGLGSSFGWETGYAMNAARDLGPRLVTWMLGYGNEVFTSGDNYFWIPVVAPFAGTLFGGLLYDLFIHTGGRSPIHTPWTNIAEVV